METILVLLAVFASILLILVVLVQPGKAEMISGMGGIGGQFSNMFGVRQSRNFLQNLTIGLTAAIMLISILVNKVFLPTGESSERAPVTQGAAIPTTPSAPPTQSVPTATPAQAPASAPSQGK
ncbi:MAG: preprotein translocase subunit SecG [Ignavibacteria bacterium]|nr:preprotein translocase subunit SecG [Ignavibacteria bacterium]